MQYYRLEFTPPKTMTFWPVSEEDVSTSNPPLYEFNKIGEVADPIEALRLLLAPRFEDLVDQQKTAGVTIKKFTGTCQFDDKQNLKVWAIAETA